MLDDDTTEPLEWKLINTSGNVLLSGQTTVKGEDKVSRTHLHEIDFSEFTTPGSGYQIIVGTINSVNFDIADQLYNPSAL